MKKTLGVTLALVLVVPSFAADQTREQKRLEACGQVFKEILNIPDGIPKELLRYWQSSGALRPELKLPIISLRFNRSQFARTENWMLRE
jgi:hypothetical protein